MRKINPLGNADRFDQVVVVVFVDRTPLLLYISGVAAPLGNVVNNTICLLMKM